VSCTSPRACTAVGDYQKDHGDARPLAERWDGKRWRVQTTTRSAGVPFGVLSGVSCTSVSACTATGYRFVLPGIQVTLAVTTSGATPRPLKWTVQVQDAEAKATGTMIAPQ
jgi:hypothetical protein